jgi:putative transposase
MIDAYSSYVLGFYLSFYGPGLTSVSGVIRNAVIPKDDLVAAFTLEHLWLSHGVPDELIMDNGLEFHAKSFRLMSWELAMDLMYCRVRTPWLKPHVERFFATLNYLTLVNGRVHKRIANVLNLDPMKDAAIRFSDLVKGLTMFVADVHPFEVNERKLARPHDLMLEGLQRCPPAEYPGSWDQLKLTSALSKQLTVGPGGIELHGLPYGGGELRPLHKRYGERVKTLVKWDPDDIEVVYVQDPVDKSWICCPSRWPEYTAGLSWNQHLMTRKFAREELKANDALETLRRAQLCLHEHWMGATKRHTRSDALTAARAAGVSSAKVFAGVEAVAPRPESIVAQTDAVVETAEIPEFESFLMRAAA